MMTKLRSFSSDEIANLRTGQRPESLLSQLLDIVEDYNASLEKAKALQPLVEQMTTAIEKAKALSAATRAHAQEHLDKGVEVGKAALLNVYCDEFDEALRNG